MFWWFCFTMGHMVGLSPKTWWIMIPLPQVKITFFTSFFCMYTVLHNHIKSYKCIFLHLHFYIWLHKIIYIYILTQSPKQFTHTTRVSTWSSIQRGRSLTTYYAKQAVACKFILSEPLSSLGLTPYNLSTLQCFCFSHHSWFLFYMCEGLGVWKGTKPFKDTKRIL
jgi:hypothetical protein